MIKEHAETRRVLDSDGVVIASSGNEIKWPLITRSHNLYDSGNVVGRIEISRPLRPVLVDTLVVGLFSSCSWCLRICDPEDIPASGLVEDITISAY